MGGIVTSQTERSTDRIRGRGDDTRTSETTLTDLDTVTDSIKLKGKSKDSVTFSNTDIWFKNEFKSSEEEFMRSRNTEFKGYGFGSFTKVYAFLDSQKPIIVPKLIEIVTTSKVVKLVVL